MDWRAPVVLLFIGSQLFAAALAQSFRHGEGNKKVIPAVFAFGDSIMDTGNNNVLPTMSRCNFPPYGKDFQDHQASGRFSKGRVPSDLIASALGIKELLPPYLTTTQDDELLTGVSFASGGTGYDPMTSRMAGVLAMPDQLNLLREYTTRVASSAGEEKAKWIVSNGLHIVCGGSNDVINHYVYTAPLNVSTYVGALAQSASAFLQDLYQLGARKIGVVGLPPLGCIPSLRTLAGDSQRNCSLPHNQASAQYNALLAMEVEQLARNLTDATIVYMDIYTPLEDIIHRPSAYGFMEASKGCCGTGLLEMSMLCNSLSATTCSNDAKYVFWDSVHPTEKTYKIIVKELLESASTLFI